MQLEQKSEDNTIDNIDSSQVELQASSYEYQVTLIRQKTLWYWILNKVFGMSKSFSAMWANRFLDWKCTRCVYILGSSLGYIFGTNGIFKYKQKLLSF